MIECFPSVRSLHVAAALTSGALFALRGLAMWRGSSLGMSGPVRWTSYAIDTVLLAAAMTLAYWLRLVPFADRWLTTKIALVILYVVLAASASAWRCWPLPPCISSPATTVQRAGPLLRARSFHDPWCVAAVAAVAS